MKPSVAHGAQGAPEHIITRMPCFVAHAGDVEKHAQQMVLQPLQVVVRERTELVRRYGPAVSCISKDEAWYCMWFSVCQSFVAAAVPQGVCTISSIMARSRHAIRVHSAVSMRPCAR